MTRVLLWLLLIAVLIAAYASISKGAVGKAFVLGGGALLALITVALVKRARRHNQELRAFMADDHAAHEAAVRGELDKAREIYQRWVAASSQQVAGVASLQLASVLRRQGELEDAIDTLRLEYQLHPSSPRAPRVTSELAACYALLGKLDEARAWSNKLDDVAAYRAFARAVIDCRAGDCASAARMLDEHWTEYESVLTGHALRPLRIVHAFARAQTGVRNAGVAEATLISVRPRFAGEYDYLGKTWPEMATFLITHQLV
jgi:tetratricopeptide (TPR) repeat protein